MKTKYILPLFTFLALQSVFAIAQDGSFDKLNFSQITKGSGATDYFGWGLNLNPAIDVRPNATRQAFIINHHDGLTFSAHSNYGGIRFYNQGHPIGPLEPSTGATMVMSINNNAVGIGTTTPRVPLDVGIYASNKKLSTVLSRLPEGDGTAEGTFLGVRGFGTQQNSDYGMKSFALEHAFYGEVNSSINFYRGGSTTGGEISFNTNTNIERMRIDVYGNVGIGTPTPREKLSVNGNIRAKEVKVETANWPDYVFEEDYKVVKLDELESYIKTNKHLPEIPSAKEVEANGVKLGEMNKKLLQKVEELTLYLIEQNKALTLQQKQLEKQQEEINVLKKNRK